MTAKSPPIPPEQRSYRGQKADVSGDTQGRRDETTGLQSTEPGDGDVNLKEQGRQGNINQNTHHQGYQQDR
ncbi:MAG: hypothetical protein ACK4YQ_07200 [Phenylobacterium sp.]|uniref:hypothetical protein n=1 Tax=Phenylobacterium sp. TaxID=1871053 RepID=UPI00391CFFF6